MTKMLFCGYKNLIYIQMKKLSILFFTLLLISSCGDDAILQKIAGETSKLVISGYYSVGEKRMKTVVYETDKKDEIKKILGYITDEDSLRNDCGYNGIIELKLTKGFMNMEFNTDDNCNRIVYTYQDLLFSKKISPEGLTYLNGLIKK
jgi:hypothetical protein